MKRLFIIVLTLLFTLSFVGCSTKRFRGDYFVATNSDVNELVSNISEKNNLLNRFSENNFDFKGQVTIKTNRYLLQQDCDVKAYGKNGTINGEATIVEENIFSEKTTTKIGYTTKNGLLIKTVNQEVYNFSLGKPIDVGDYIEVPSIISDLCGLFTKNLSKIPTSLIEFCTTPQGTKVHIIINQDSAGYLFFNGNASNSSAGDIYFYFDNDYKIMGVMARLSATYSGEADDIIVGHGQINYVYVDFIIS